MPQSTDLVTDLPADFEVFGQAVATSMADLLGGTTGQVLAKNSNTDMDFIWVAQDDSNAIQNSIMDAKGDLIGATAADTPARLAVGTNGQVLTADSTAATGLAWATPATTSFTSNTNFVATAETTSSTTFTGLTTAQSFSLVTGTKALVIIGCMSENNSAAACTLYAGFAISGATTRAATEDTALSIRSNQSTVFGVAASQVIFATGLTAGTNTFTMQFKMGAGGNPGRWFNRSITVINMGS